MVNEAFLRFGRSKLMRLGRPYGFRWRPNARGRETPRYGWLSMYGPVNVGINARRLHLNPIATMLFIYALALVDVTVFFALR